MATDLFRVYEALGSDGYPHEWHGCCGELEHDPLGGIKERVREAAGNRCVRCGHPYRKGEHGNGEWSPCDERCRHGGPLRMDHRRTEAQWRILTVHHLTGNKADCRWWNLAPLCQRCHLQIQGRVNMAQVFPHEHSEWFKPYAAGYYAATYLNEDLTREQTMERLDELLALESVGCVPAEEE